MAVGVVLEFDGATLEQYDQILEKMGFSPGGAGPPGPCFTGSRPPRTESASLTCGRIVRRSSGSQKPQIGPNTAEVGIQSPPSISFFEVHNYLTAG